MSKPILMNTDMVRALLAGRKSVTRRLVYCRDGNGKRIPLPVDAMYTGKSSMFYTWVGYEPYHITPPYQPGDVLHVRETWAELETAYGVPYYAYKADDSDLHHSSGENFSRWYPSIYMPRKAARIFLRVTGVRVERLQDITPDQIDAEGCKEWAYSATTGEPLPSGPSWFCIAWDNTIKSADRATCGWEANPWVWVIEFERVEKPAKNDLDGENP